MGCFGAICVFDHDLEVLYRPESFPHARRIDAA